MDEVNKGGAPLGSQNNKRGTIIRGAIRRAFAEDEAKGRQTIQLIVRKMIDDALAGDRYSRQELFDRLDGKVETRTELSGPDGGEIPAKIVIELVRS